MKSRKRKILAICSVILSASIIFTSCASSKKESSAGNSSKQILSEDKGINAPSEKKLADSTQSGNGNTTEVKKDSTTKYENVQTTALQDRKIVKSGSITIETKTFDKAVSTLTENLQKAGGYIENSSTTGSTLNDENSFKNRSAKFVLRIPKQNYEPFISDAGNIGNITHTSNTGEDVTSQYFDTDAHVKSLKVKEERLIELLKKTGELKDILTLETELNNTRFQIESLTGNLKKWDSMVQYSTITIDIQEVEKITEAKQTSFWGKIKNTFNDSLKALLSILQGILIVLVSLLPFLPILIPIFFLVRYLIKRNNLKNNSNKENSSNNNL